MNPKQFFAGLAITSLIQIILCFVLIMVSALIRLHTAFIGGMILAMIVFSITLYGAAKIFAKSPLEKKYIQLIMIAVFIKMLLFLALIIGYKEGFRVDDNSFIWPFLLIYISSTVYEVIFMERVGREKSPRKT